MTPHDARQLSSGDTVVLLVGQYDPPHIGYSRAAEALFSQPGVSDVWLTPVSGFAEAKEFCMIMAADMSSSGRQVGCCTAGIDKDLAEPEAVVAWCRKSFPYLKFKVATMEDDVKADFMVKFASQQPIAPSGTIVSLGKYLPPPKDLKDRIAKGLDESRSFQSPVWARMQARRTYR